MISRFVKPIRYCSCSNLLKRFYGSSSNISSYKNINTLLPQQLLQQTLLINNDVKNIQCPYKKDSYFHIYDKIPFLDTSLPNMDIPLPNLDMSLPNIGANIAMNEPNILNNNFLVFDEPKSHVVSIQCKGGILKIRRKKMNKHKYKKRRKRDRAKIRKVMNMRLKRKNRIKAFRKEKLIKKIKQRLEDNPQDKYGEQPFVIHRLLKW